MEGVHHPKTKAAYIGRSEWWEDITTSRCKTCWLRKYQCYCGYVEERKQHYETLFSQQQCKIEVYMYYHHIEIGRSANTAHIFDALCECVVTPMIYGDEEAEGKLMETIKAEHESGISRTCILYPKNDAILLSKWISSSVLTTSTETENVVSNIGTEEHKHLPKVRIILLDGTYPCASRMAKALINMCAAYNISNGQCPFVKLDLSEAGCKSAVAGIMYQPGKFKICSYQAIVLALQQVYDACGQSQGLLIGDLLQDLDHWIAYIVKTKIKYTKSKPVVGIDDVDNTPAEHIQEIVNSLAKHPHRPTLTKKREEALQANPEVPMKRRDRRKVKKVCTPSVILTRTRRCFVFDLVF